MPTSKISIHKMSIFRNVYFQNYNDPKSFWIVGILEIGILILGILEVGV